MREDRTPAVLRAVESASTWANHLHRPAVDPLSLVLALLDEDEGRAATMLVNAGLDLPLARTRLSALVDDAGSIADVWAVAADHARTMSGERTIRTDHVVLAILQTSEAVRSELVATGLDLQQLHRQTQQEPAVTLTLDVPLELTDAPDDLDTIRIIDASANRAREALRVIEDYARFTLNDALLSRELKELRHQLRHTLDSLPALPLLTSRDTIGDVGTAVSTPDEAHRADATDVVRANFKRLQEALRSLEEYGKVIAPTIGKTMESIRYRSYTLERAMLLGQSSRDQLASARLYLLLTGSACATSIEFVISEAAAGGVDVIQLREKGLDDGELLARARQVRLWTRRAGVMFIMNDRPDIARLAEADGLHLGQDDIGIRQARRIVSNDAVIGVSTHSVEQLRHAVLDGVNYAGIGPVFPSRTKSFDDFPGLDFVRTATSETSLPLFALGGITRENVAKVLAAGARRIAVSSEICGDDEPGLVAAELRRQIDAFWPSTRSTVDE